MYPPRTDTEGGSWRGLTYALELLHFLDVQQKSETLCSCSHQPSPKARPSQRSPGEKKHPESQEETGASRRAQAKWQTPKQAPGGKTHSACQDTSTLLVKTRESPPGTFPCLLALATLGGSGRDRDALLVSMPLLHLQPCPRLPHQGGSAGPLPITVPVWEEGLLAMHVSWARALVQTQRRRGKM